MTEKRLKIEWHSILHDVLRNAWVVFCVVLIGLMGSYIASHSFYKPEYTSRASLIVNSAAGKTNAVASLSQSAEIASIYSEVFVQPTMKEKVCEYLEQGYFDGNIKAFVNEGTNIMEVSVTASNPIVAYRELSAVIKVYPKLTETLFSNGVIGVLRYPSVSARPSNSMTTMNYIKLSIVCAFLGVMMIVAVSILRDSVKNSDDFRESVDSNLIGSIPHERKPLSIIDRIKRRKKSILIYEDVYTSLKFTENFNKISSKIEYMHKNKGDKVFAITSVSENEGKSTVSSNIAISLAIKGNSVLLADFDGKKPALYKIFEKGYVEGSEFADLLSGKVSLDDFKFRRYRKTKLFLALNTQAYRNSGRWLESGNAKKIIDELRERVDYIIVDTAPLTVDSSVTGLANICDETLLVVRTDGVYSSVVNDSLLTLKNTGAKVAGCILNDEYTDFSAFGQFGTDESGYYSYSHYSKYGSGKYSKYSKYSKYGKYNKYSKYSRYGNYSNYNKYNKYAKYSKYSKYAKYSSYDKYSKYGYGKYGYGKYADPSVFEEIDDDEDIFADDVSAPETEEIVVTDNAVNSEDGGNV